MNLHVYEPEAEPNTEKQKRVVERTYVLDNQTTCNTEAGVRLRLTNSNGNTEYVCLCADLGVAQDDYNAAVLRIRDEINLLLKRIEYHKTH